MNKEVKKKWLEALRSGKYSQGRYALREIDENAISSYCCLGVLCDITPGVMWKSTIAIYDNSKEKALLPIKLSGELGLSSVEHDALVRMNDFGGKSFTEIADWIERNL